MKLNIRFLKVSEKTFSKLIIICSIVLILFLLFLNLNPAYGSPPAAIEIIRSALTSQLQIEASIRSEFKAGQYSFTSPLVIQNPYGTAPLTALLIFDTPQKAQISVHVPGNTPEANVDFTFPGYQTHHEIPIYGLYAGKSNEVTIQATTQNGDKQKAAVTLQTEPLPVYLEPMKIIQSKPEKYSPGLNFSFLDHKTIYDIDGAIRWYSTEVTFKVYSPLRNGRFLYIYNNNVDTFSILMEKDLLGKIYAVYHLPDNVHHDVYELPNGNFLLTSEDPHSNKIMDTIHEVDRQNGHIIRTIDLKNYLDINRPIEIDRPSYDWLHLNSIDYDPSDQSIVISARSQSAVIKFSYPDMKIRWILGSHDNWSAAFQPYLLTPIGEPFSWQWSQHHATVYRNNPGNPNSLDLLLFDNGLYRSFQRETAYTPRESYSRVVHYQIDEKAKTVRQVWEYGKERGSDLFSVTQGSVYWLENGNILGTWANVAKDVSTKGLREILKNGTGSDTETRIIEINPQNTEVAYEASIPGDTSYRVFRAGLYDRYSEDNNLMNTRVNNTSRSDLYDRLQVFSQDGESWGAQAWINIKRIARRVL